MKPQGRKYLVTSRILGGGLDLREGQVVDEERLRQFREGLERAGGIQRLPDGQDQRPRPGAQHV